MHSLQNLAKEIDTISRRHRISHSEAIKFISSTKKIPISKFEPFLTILKNRGESPFIYFLYPSIFCPFVDFSDYSLKCNPSGLEDRFSFSYLSKAYSNLLFLAMNRNLVDKYKKVYFLGDMPLTFLERPEFEMIFCKSEHDFPKDPFILICNHKLANSEYIRMYQQYPITKAMFLFSVEEEKETFFECDHFFIPFSKRSNRTVISSPVSKEKTEYSKLSYDATLTYYNTITRKQHIVECPTIQDIRKSYEEIYVFYILQLYFGERTPHTFKNILHMIRIISNGNTRAFDVRSLQRALPAEIDILEDH